MCTFKEAKQQPVNNFSRIDVFGKTTSFNGYESYGYRSDSTVVATSTATALVISCDRDPDEQFTRFCPSCLCERLTTLDQSSSNTPSSSCRPSSAIAAAIKSFSASKNEALGLFFKPQRKSCDVRSQNSKQCDSIVANEPILKEPENGDDEEFIEPETMEDFASAVNADEDNDNDDENGDEIIPSC
ncbi:Hypothetical predicted protein [Olea europaea subsp. europaea]|uniref:Uncharacterized protein n=1 Tax=Olea europaea subsp. europaea TaxID=158383 RepID=A0A8S0T8P6_OLEEU|nr:Hypothetical predicted protein [Olea europaea subsp. europaea]